jgi:hypothetical protein
MNSDDQDLEVETTKNVGKTVVATPLITPDVAKDALLARCKAAGFPFKEAILSTNEKTIKLGMNCGRNVRWLIARSIDDVNNLLSIPFEKFIFLSDYEAVCCYELGLIEAAIRPIPAGFLPSSFALRRLFNTANDPNFNIQSVQILLSPPQGGMPQIELSSESEFFTKLVLGLGPRPARLTLKLNGCRVATHDQALSLLKKTADAVFFQIDMLTDTSLSLERERRRYSLTRRSQKKVDLAEELQYPKTEFDDAPLSLYWYARSASGMPLLQFLAFYQVIEFYFPTYSQAEAQRKLKAILKDPTFRGDRDADIGKLLSSIQISRSGAFGDERAQLRATLAECLDPDGLRSFLEADSERKEFYASKGKGPQFHKIPLVNPTADLRVDVANRIYDIRCKIVHSKGDSRNSEVELLLPFSREAEQLSFDIELVQYVAQLVLIAGSTPFQSL